ncbi:hypothetical protein VSDG_03151 [Cytospora chrysosperma]|uniref:Uncharacterized protein n=1 Tax=Cytospora chrysosperma TaxID=252740 RepID=A0A423W8R3_CYTCH|nr:hypothetical protein VSDG_03151 [Valsa sordida]
MADKGILYQGYNAENINYTEKGHYIEDHKRQDKLQILGNLHTGGHGHFGGGNIAGRRLAR